MADYLPTPTKCKGSSQNRQGRRPCIVCYFRKYLRLFTQYDWAACHAYNPAAALTLPARLPTSFSNLLGSSLLPLLKPSTCLQAMLHLEKGFEKASEKKFVDGNVVDW